MIISFSFSYCIETSFCFSFFKNFQFRELFKKQNENDKQNEFKISTTARMTSYQISHHFNIGYLHLFSDGTNITRLDFADEELKEQHSCEILEIAKKQLHEYFANTRQTFDLPLLPFGTEFQKKIWDILLQIEFSETKSYEWVSLQYGNKKAIRAVGQAIGKNPIAIIVPCHRVIGKNGTLTGFAGGLKRKELLLNLESAL